MITLTQLQELATGRTWGLHGLEFHFTGKHDCKRTVGPRGGVKVSVVVVRVTGELKTWKTRPGEFRLPVKHGMYESSAIWHGNTDNWHLASECPLAHDGHDEFVAAG